MSLPLVHSNFEMHLGEDAHDKYRASTPEIITDMLGLPCEEHSVCTKDGYVLVLHRIPPRRGVHGAPPVLLQHGLMMSSEAWFATGERSLPVLLHNAGYDVYLGNNRGNTYSCKHLHLRSSDTEYWDFCMDEMARYDVPTMIDHVLAVSGADSLSWIGFSQGTAQMFAALAMYPQLQAKVNCFAAMSAAVAVRGLAESALSSLIQSDPNFIYGLFGKRSMIASTLVWRNILAPRRFLWFIERSLAFLFNWDMDNTVLGDRLMGSAHLFSTSSVQSVVAWFKIMKSRRFQAMLHESAAGRGQQPPRYDFSHCSIPLACFVGGKDTIIDVIGLTAQLPDTAYLYYEPEYNHLDFLWARGLTDPGRAFESLLAWLGEHAPPVDDGREVLASPEMEQLASLAGVAESPTPELKMTGAATPRAAQILARSALRKSTQHAPAPFGGKPRLLNNPKEASASLYTYLRDVHVPQAVADTLVLNTRVAIPTELDASGQALLALPAAASQAAAAARSRGSDAEELSSMASPRDTASHLSLNSSARLLTALVRLRRRARVNLKAKQERAERAAEDPTPREGGDSTPGWATLARWIRSEYRHGRDADDDASQAPFSPPVPTLAHYVRRSIGQLTVPMQSPSSEEEEVLDMQDASLASQRSYATSEPDEASELPANSASQLPVSESLVRAARHAQAKQTMAMRRRLGQSREGTIGINVDEDASPVAAYIGELRPLLASLIWHAARA